MASVAVVGAGIGSGVLLGSSVVGGSELCSAKPYTGKTEAELDEYIHKTWKKFFFLPSYDNKIHWDVYLLYKSFFGHYSMLFVTPGHIEGFLIHLVLNKDKKTTEFRVDAVNLRSYPDDHPDLKALSLGTTEAITAKRIITKAHDRLVNMGRYNLLFNNCQNFCKELASAIEVEKSICKTWYEEIYAILKGAIKAAVAFTTEITIASAVVLGTVVESARSMQRIGPQTDSSLTKPIKKLCDEYEAKFKKDA